MQHQISSCFKPVVLDILGVPCEFSGLCHWQLWTLPRLHRIHKNMISFKYSQNTCLLGDLLKPITLWLSDRARKCFSATAISWPKCTRSGLPPYCAQLRLRKEVTGSSCFKKRPPSLSSINDFSVMNTFLDCRLVLAQKYPTLFFPSGSKPILISGFVAQALHSLRMIRRISPSRLAKVLAAACTNGRSQKQMTIWTTHRMNVTLDHFGMLRY